MPWLKIIRAYFIISKWSKHALYDGEISFQEALNLALKLAKLLGLPTAFDIGKISDIIKNLPKKASKITEDNQP